MTDKPQFVGEKVRLDYLDFDVPLWSVTVWDKKFTEVNREWQPKTIKYKYLLSSELDEINVGGDVALLYTGQDKGSTTVELAGDALAEGEVISIPWGGTPSVKYHIGKFVTGDNRIATSAIPDRLLNKYIYYFLKGRIRELESYYRGAGLKHPSMKAVLGMKISFPSVEQQKKVITQFEAIEAQMALSENQLSRFDQLIKSRFVEVFGDGSQYQTCRMNRLIVSIKAGTNIGGNQRILEQDEYAVLKISAVTSGTFCPDEYKVVDDVSSIKMIHPRKGDLLFSRANTSEMVGATAIVDQDYEQLFLPDKLWRLDPADDVNRVFLKHLLSSAKLRVEMSKVATGSSGSMQNISMEKFRALKAFIPPLALQQEFAAFVSQVDKLRFVAQQQIEKLQMLYDSLAQEYFA